MGFGGQVTLDVAGTPEPLYQNLRGDSPTPLVRFVKVIADSDNTGVTIIGPFKEVSASAPKYGDYELGPGHVAWIEATGGDMVQLEEWWCDTENAGNIVRWSVATGARTDAETIVV